MFPEANAPAPTQQWVRAVEERLSKVNRTATSVERNAYNLADSTRASYEHIDNRVANINNFTTGLFDQVAYSDSQSDYAGLSSLPLLYQFASGNFETRAAVLQRIPFAKYTDLTVQIDGAFQGYTTSTTATGIARDRDVIPMCMATIPPLARMNANGSLTENALTWGSRWTVENFEPFVNYTIPGNTVPNSFSSSYGQATVGYHPDFSPTTQTQKTLDGYTGYSMRYTRQWLTEFMDAIRVYSTNSNPPPAGAYYYAPDVNQIEIIVGYFYSPYTSATATNVLHVNDSRLAFSTSGTFLFDGVKNLGY